jgi:hypothetical protein
LIDLTPGDDARRQCQAFGLRIKARRVQLKDGEAEFLITSLLDEEAFPALLFKHLCHLPWGIAEG